MPRYNTPQSITRRGIQLVDFSAGNKSTTDLKTFFTDDLMLSNEIVTPSAGGTFALNGNALGSYDYVLKRTNQSLSSFNVSDWFTTTEDTRSALIGVAGDLTIDAGVFFTPSRRKLFTAIYVDGNLTVNGKISMSARGANHSGTGNSAGATTAADIRLATGTFGGIVNPIIPAAGSAGGATSNNAAPAVNQGQDSPAATNGGTGGGGGGAGRNVTSASSGTGGSGSAGTCFASGSGGGACYSNGVSFFGGNGIVNGGAGGNQTGNDNGYMGAGAGNPAGQYTGSTSNLAFSTPARTYVDVRSNNRNPLAHHNGIALAANESIGAMPHDDNFGAASTHQHFVSPAGKSHSFNVADLYERGCAGSLIIFCTGTFSGSGHIGSEGRDGGFDGGGGTGGGSTTIFFNTDTSSITPVANGKRGSAYNNANGGFGGQGTARKLGGL
jgi:hypothetical protein